MEIERVVAEYAPIGARRHRRRLMLRRCLAAGTVALLVGTAIAALSRFGPVESLAIADRVGALLDRSGDRNEQRAASEHDAFADRVTALERRIASVQAQTRDLEAQKLAFAEQSEELAGLLGRLGSQQTELESRRTQGSQLDREIAAIAAQRAALEDRWAQFEAQGELLALEIVAVNAQRKELEAQRRQIERQQKELAELLEKAEGLYRRNASSAGAGPHQEQSDSTVDDNVIASAESISAVGADELNDMRGGFSVGEGLDVSFGFTQIGSVNGVEQFEHNFTIDNMASGMSTADMANMSSVVLQNGPGNFVSSRVLDALANRFGNVIQNTLDDQSITTTTIYDISLENVPGAVQGIYGEWALNDALGAF